MYYPYLRGRQNELLCLRELLENDRLSDTVTPVIEPVKCTSTFFSTVKKFIEKDRNIIVIANPQVGVFVKEYKEIIEDAKTTESDKIKKTAEEYQAILNNAKVIKAYILNSRTAKKIADAELEKKENLFLISENKGDDQFFIKYRDALVTKAALIPKDEDFKDEVESDCIILEDCYEKKKRNVDYIEEPDVFFSKNHLIYAKRGYIGFSDYSIVGKSYEESGFAPLAIAIHITYFDDRNTLWVHHFVSESNQNISDPARKFQEAMENLMVWENFDRLEQTMGLQTLINYYENEKFPGLGVIKKYSIMHHIEMIGKYLEENR